MTVYIIYHQIKPGVDCPDGIAAAWVASKKYPNAEILGCSYQGEIPEFEGGDRVIIVDFSFPAEIMQGWAKKGVDLFVIDHHKTAEQNLSQIKGNIALHFNMEECGATLTWKVFFPEKEPPAFLKFVRDRDLWIWEYPQTAIIHEAMGFIGRSFDLFDLLENMSKEELLSCLYPLGDRLLKKKEVLVANLAQQAEIARFEGYSVPYIKIAPEHERLTSDICAYIYTHKFPFCLFVAAKLEEGFSLRSDKNGSNFDVSEIAKKYGGGGHCNAAGYRMVFES